MQQQAIAVVTLKEKGTDLFYSQNVKVYAFNENNHYTGKSATTNEQGKAPFDRDQFGEGSYTFRADLLGNHYWSDTIANTGGGTSATIDTGGGTITFNLHDNTTPLANIKTYLFTPSGSYLGLTSTSNEQGQVSYQVPAGNFTLRPRVNTQLRMHGYGGVAFIRVE